MSSIPRLYATGRRRKGTIDAVQGYTRAIVWKGKFPLRTIAVAFRDHQSDILTRLDEAEALMCAESEPPRALLDDSRLAIGAALDAYQAFKHGRVYNPIIAAGGTDAAAASALKADCEQLSEDYRTYMARAGTAASFDAHCAATRAMADRVKLALIREFELVQRLDVYRDYAERPA